MVQIRADENRIVWQIESVPETTRVVLHGRDVVLTAIDDVGGGIDVMVESFLPFELEIETHFTSFFESVPAGKTAYLLTYLDRTDVRQW